MHQALRLSGILLFAAAIGCSGCSTKPGAPGRAAAEEQHGVLMSWDSTPLPPGTTPQEMLTMFEERWKQMPADVRVVSRAPRQVIMTLDMAAAGRAMAPRADPNDTESVPVRMVVEVAPRDGVEHMITRQYYIGSDPALLAEIESNVKRAREAGNHPPN